MKKKGIALVLVLALALTLIGVAVAAGDSNLTMETSATAAVDDGSTVTVTVKNKAATFNALTFYVEFPTKDLTVKNVTWQTKDGVDCCKEPVVGDTVVAGGASTPDEANASGKVGFYYLDVGAADGTDKDGKQYGEGAFQAVITFQVKKVHAVGEGRDDIDSAAISLHEDSEGANGLITVLNNWLGKDNANIPFSHVALPFVLGDVNDDNSIDAQDAQNIQRYAAGLSSSITAENTDAADVNKDGSVDAQDAQNIQRYAAGLSSSFDTIS